jgi:mono/diheme cytochrome c family protein
VARVALTWRVRHGGRAVGFSCALAALAGCDGGAVGGWGGGVASMPVESGAELYARHCAACHGAQGRGDGPAIGTGPRAADLTGLSRANGGVFPLVAVMSRIDGYAQDGSGAMPVFGLILQGNEVLLETAPGEAVPTPERLVRLAEHLASLQHP